MANATRPDRHVAVGCQLERDALRMIADPARLIGIAPVWQDTLYAVRGIADAACRVEAFVVKTGFEGSASGAGERALSNPTVAAPASTTPTTIARYRRALVAGVASGVVGTTASA